MNTEPIVTEDDLHAFIDDALPPDRRRDVEDVLARDASAARRWPRSRPSRSRPR